MNFKKLSENDCKILADDDLLAIHCLVSDKIHDDEWMKEANFFIKKYG